MQTIEDLVSDVTVTEPSQPSALSAEHAQALGDIESGATQLQAAFAQLESDTANLEAAFLELERLQDAEKEAHLALEQTLGEEKQVLANGETSEEKAVKKLLEVRGRKDVRSARLTEARKRIALQADLIQYDFGEPLRHKFASFANTLLHAKEIETTAIFSQLLPVDHGLPVSIQRLVQASIPVTRFRRAANWTQITLPQDQTEHLQELRQLVPKWMEALRELIEEPTQ